ncbi:unnamed protein product, partial [Symbiodinium necroappetens]
RRPHTSCRDSRCRLNLLSYNCGGFTSAAWAEFTHWLDTQSYDVVVVQETHWQSEGCFTLPRWYCITAAAPTDDKYSGILVMVASKLACPEHIRYSVLHPGRLLHVKIGGLTVTHSSIDVLGVYQYVWRSTATKAENLANRAVIWNQLDKTATKLPVRNTRLVMGDLNTRPPPDLGLESRHLSNSGPQDADASKFRSFIDAANLMTLNTWSGPKAFTHQHAGHRTIIDYILADKDLADVQARRSAPMHHCPLASWKDSKHWPVAANVRLRQAWMHRRRARDTCSIDVQSLRYAVRHDTPEAAQLQVTVERKLRALIVPTTADQLHAAINACLLQACTEAFPLKAKQSADVAADALDKRLQNYYSTIAVSCRRSRPAQIAESTSPPLKQCELTGRALTERTRSNRLPQNTMMEGLNAEMREIFGTSLPSLMTSRPSQASNGQPPLNPKRQRQESHGGGRPRQLQPVTNHMQASLEVQVAQLARVVMKHEDQINTAKLDRGFVFFMRNSEGSILQNLFEISQRTRQAYDNGQVQDNPLRILLLKALFVELEGRLKMLDQDPQALEKTKQQGLLGDQGWFYKRWDRKARKLVDDPQRTPLPSKEMATLLMDMFRLLNASTVLKFGASRGIHEEVLEDPDSTTVFLMEISLRGKAGDPPPLGASAEVRTDGTVTKHHFRLALRERSHQSEKACGAPALLSWNEVTSP